METSIYIIFIWDVTLSLIHIFSRIFLKFILLVEKFRFKDEQHAVRSVRQTSSRKEISGIARKKSNINRKKRVE
jgi:hypothetical protein